MRSTEHEDHGRINWITTEARTVYRQPAGQGLVDLQPNDHLARPRRLGDRIGGERHA